MSKEYIELLKKIIETSNPSFTEYSFRRTIEVIIIKVEKLNFLNKVDDNKIDKIISMIPSDLEIKKRIRT